MRDGTSLVGRVVLVLLRVSGMVVTVTSTALTACRPVSAAATAVSSCARISLFCVV